MKRYLLPVFLVAVGILFGRWSKDDAPIIEEVLQLQPVLVLEVPVEVPVPVVLPMGMTREDYQDAKTGACDTCHVSLGLPAPADMLLTGEEQEAMINGLAGITDQIAGDITSEIQEDAFNDGNFYQFDDNSQYNVDPGIFWVPESMVDYE